MLRFNNFTDEYKYFVQGYVLPLMGMSGKPAKFYDADDVKGEIGSSIVVGVVDTGKNKGFIENLVVFYLENSGHKITLYTKRWFALANHFFLCYNIFRYFSIFGGFLLTLNQYLL